MARKNRAIPLSVQALSEPKGTKHVGNPALTGDSVNLQEGDNAKFISVGLSLFDMPKVDLHNPEEVKGRIKEYLSLHANADVKPTVSGLAMALGVDRRRLWEIATGNFANKTQANLPKESKDLIKKTYDFLGNLWEDYMQNGKINPVSGIFLAKNHFGYRDQQEVVVTPNTPESEYSAADIAARYALPEADEK